MTDTYTNVTRYIQLGSSVYVQQWTDDKIANGWKLEKADQDVTAKSAPVDYKAVIANLATKVSAKP